MLQIPTIEHELSEPGDSVVVVVAGSIVLTINARGSVPTRSCVNREQY
jgi:hypothetical protein